MAALPAAAEDSPVVPTPAFPPLGATWLQTVNLYRAQSGLAPVTAEPAWMQGQTDHIEYLANTPYELRTGAFASAHTENPASQWSTADGAIAAAASNITIGSTEAERGLIDHWMGAPFHAIGILRRDLTRVSFATKDGTAMLDVVRGRAPLTAPVTDPVLFPGPHSTTYLSQFVAESPDPREGCAADWGSFRGLPIIALLPEAPLPDTTASLTLPDGTVLEQGANLCVQTAATYRSTDTVHGASAQSALASENAVVVIPRVALGPGVHVVSIRQDGLAHVSWPFTVVRTPNAPRTSRAIWAGGNRAVLWWTPPIDDGGSPVTGSARFVNRTAPSYVHLGDLTSRQVVADIDPEDAGNVSGAITIAALNQVGPGSRIGVGWTRPSLPGSPTDSHIVAAVTGAPPGTSAVLVNLAMTDGVEPGYITADECSTMRDQPQTKASGNHGVGTAIANLSVVPVDALGVFCLYSQVPTHLVVDVQGRFSPTAPLRFTSVAPQRLIDTRAGASPAPGSIVRVETGLAGVATAALVNLAMADGPSAGYITADGCSWLTPGPQTKASGNHGAAVAISNLAVVSLDDDGAFCVYTQRGAHVIADLQGWFSTDGALGFESTAPRRVLDTRDTGMHPGADAITVVHTGIGDGSAAALVNVAMVDGLSPGYITADTCDVLRAGAQTKASGNHDGTFAAANLAVVPLAPDGTFCIYTQAFVHLVVDVQGSFSPTGRLGFEPVVPGRVLDTRL
jgi:hypothetical protein